MIEKPGADAVAPSTCVVGAQWFGRVAVVSAAGTVDMLTAPQLEAGIAAALDKDPSAVVVDLTEVEFLASAGMSVLMAARQQSPSTVALAVVADGPVTARPLQLVGIAEIIDVFPRLEEALAKVGA